MNSVQASRSASAATKGVGAANTAVVATAARIAKIAESFMMYVFQIMWVIEIK